jgi:hypothetical protein
MATKATTSTMAAPEQPPAPETDAAPDPKPRCTDPSHVLDDGRPPVGKVYELSSEAGAFPGSIAVRVIACGAHKPKWAS